MWEKHWLPGEGKNDWHSIVDALSDINYPGIWIYEVPFGSLKSLSYERRALTCEDFVRNAEEILNKREITIIK